MIISEKIIREITNEYSFTAKELKDKLSLRGNIKAAIYSDKLGEIRIVTKDIIIEKDWKRSE